MDLSQTVALLLVFLTTLAVFVLTHQKKAVVVHLILLLITPYVLFLLVTNPLSFIGPNELVCNVSSNNSSCLTSFDFLFFRGDTRPGFNLGDYGLFLPSFIPLLLIGIHSALTSKTKGQKLLLVSFIVGITIAYFVPDHGLKAALLFVPIISVLSTLGMLELINSFKKNHLFIKAATISTSALILYEALRAYQMIIFHGPLNL